MKIAGIVAEYNPFHKGHMYQLKKVSLESKVIVVIVSSYFSQRGLPSLMSLEDKTRLALEHGANLVLELPPCYACQSADYFAKYAIQSLKTLGVTDLYFGSELHDLETLEMISNRNNANIDPSTSQAKNNIALSPNDILGVQYIKECQIHEIECHPLKRNNEYKSATQTRADFKKGMEQDFQEYFQKNQTWESYYPYLKTFLSLTSVQDLASFFLVNEGIENRLKQAAMHSNTWAEFLQKSVSKTYSRARIQRTCVMILLQIKKSQMEDPSFYQIKVAGFDAIGKELLKGKEKIMKFSDMDPFMKEVELKTLSLYNSVQRHKISRQVVIKP
ncbi:MAG: nucleotidyltransferase family protein [Bacillota bacterium]|nr:nucleotidyltransferase family protein [Bacillota bacterium]